MPIAETATTDPTSLPLWWLDSHGDALYAYAVRRVRRRDVAEDLVQETLLAAMESSEHFAGRSNVRTWLTAILRNKISDLLRVRYRNPESEARSEAEQDLFDRRGRWKVAVPAWRGDPADLAEQRELRGVLDSCVSKLPKSMAHLFLSRVADQIPTGDLCDELNINPENAWAMLSRARSRLRQCLTVHWFTDPPASGLKRSRKT